MTAPTKYTATVAPPVSNQRVYLSEEFRKIAAAMSNLLAALEEIEDMSLTESGVFRPVIIGATTAGVGTYTTQEGHFYKVNRLIIVQFRIVTSGHTGTGQAIVTGLPYAAKTFAGTAGHVVTDVFSDTNAISGGLIPTSTPDRMNLYSGFPKAAFNVTGVMDFIVNLAYITNS